ncbi:MAG: exodeoxyribonuclease VII small subunit [Dehalococcoidia bacterium]|nr:exodeoxyribonuclease VII small subunit [Dehalococcoidia bacterium]HCV00845.1 exodeoxyribonuclease VII small subunit [Dehalococcoidia bacterium]|tara:strand:+ start:286 stop:546 length:261 start_codon:yes stop_codon:yes gene_type:complete
MAEPAFEELVAQLEECARKLETGNIPLEEGLAIFEEGAALVDQLRKLLSTAELRVQRLQDSLQEGGSYREETPLNDETANSDDTTS